MRKAQQHMDFVDKTKIILCTAADNFIKRWYKYLTLIQLFINTYSNKTTFRMDYYYYIIISKSFMKYVYFNFKTGVNEKHLSVKKKKIQFLI